MSLYLRLSRSITLIALSWLFLCTSIQASEPEIEFPGRGNQSDWESAWKIAHKGVDCFHHGNFDQAQTWFKKAISIYPYDAWFYYDYAKCVKKSKKDFAESIVFYKKAIELNPRFSDAYDNMADSYVKLQRYDEAEKVSIKALSINKSACSMLNLAEIKMAQKKYDDARKWLQSAKGCPDAQEFEADLKADFEKLHTLSGLQAGD
jgi:tetratricopeptide (TPR) repeat protein